MTIEELKAELDEAKAGIEALSNKNKELLSELKTERKKSREIDVDKHNEVLDNLEALKSENAKLQSDLKLKTKDSEALSKQLQDKDGFLNNLLIDNGLTDALLKAGVDKNLLKFVKADLKSQAKLMNENGEYKAMIGDKPINDFITEWANGEGKAVIIPPQNSGGGAGGNNNSTPPPQKIDGLSPTEMMKLGRQQK